MKLNKAQRDAIQREIDEVEDDLYRAKMQKRADPNWKSGNGESIDKVLKGYQSRLDALKKGF